jgi:hypothetical protein
VALSTVFSVIAAAPCGKEWGIIAAGTGQSKPHRQKRQSL